LENVLETQTNEIPEELRGLIPDELSVKQKLDWISRNKTLLLKPVAPDIGAGIRGAGTGSAVKLSPEQIEMARKTGVSVEDYAANLKRN
jgi:hypothetical protein